ncbi:MAG: hypothetical protein CL904_02440 [Dehalococcoidia bacterium]|nr:hypothetical protein [Dehalococcoidia bacterium]MQG15589.1 regulatory protein RecX [SAR202 cluster bacterium]|tara:strand:- start:65223 stop:65711 length:489 start_codon:yes stop_codon:yes gene_type:complete
MSETSNNSARSDAFRLLNYRPRSVSEIQKRLMEKYDKDTVEITVSSLLESELLDDQKFAIWWTESRVRQKLLSSSMIRRELVQKGVSTSEIQIALNSVDDNINAHKLAEKLGHTVSKNDLIQFKRKLYGKITRRGFSSSLASAAIEKTCDSFIDSKEISLEW